MRPSQSYVLIYDQQPEDLRLLRSVLEQMGCPLVVAHSADQVMMMVSQAPPYLVILAGEHQNWSRSMVNELRRLDGRGKVTIVALTDFHAPRWLPKEEHPGLDGFLVKPLSGDVLTSVIASAWARQACCSTY